MFSPLKEANFCCREVSLTNTCNHLCTRHVQQIFESEQLDRFSMTIVMACWCEYTLWVLHDDRRVGVPCICAFRYNLMRFLPAQNSLKIQTFFVDVEPILGLISQFKALTYKMRVSTAVVSLAAFPLLGAADPVVTRAELSPSSNLSAVLRNTTVIY